MCGLFGFTVYGKKPIKDLEDITDALSKESAERGTDAVGIAYRKGDRIRLMKESKPSYSVTFKHPDTVKVLIGHTRHATQGKADKLYNNHPFFGATPTARFALAHNGIITNDEALRKLKGLPQTKIETDSYVAVQLLEKQNAVCAQTIASMAEQIEGSYSFSILDEHDRLFLVKGDSPLAVLHFPREKMYVYASTEEILWRALIETPLFKSIKDGAVEPIPIERGDILTIEPDGSLGTTHFKVKERVLPIYPRYPFGYYGTLLDEDDEDGYSEYLDDLRAFAESEGVRSSDVDKMLGMGFAPEEIEEYLYESCGAEI